MKIKGYKLSGYDATYRQTMFDITQRGDSVLEVTDMGTGTTFILDLEEINLSSSKTSCWRGDEVKGQGVSITFGSRGMFEQLKYQGRKFKS